MATAILTPRVNNNDDVVRLTQVHCEPGRRVQQGDLVAEIETDKASFTVEAEHEGILLGFTHRIGDMVPVGSVLAWVGSSADEPMPATTEAEPSRSETREPTLKAALLLARLGLTPAEVPAAGERLTAQEVLAYVQHRDRERVVAPPDGHRTAAQAPATDLAPGERVPLTPPERGMLRTVLWHRDSAVPGYVEIEYEIDAWERYAATFQQRHALLLSPVLPLMAYRLVQLAGENAKVNSTIQDGDRYQYHTVNLGFTQQTGSRLSLLCVRDAQHLTPRQFVDTLGTLMRQTMKSRLGAAETSAITISFSSMARWQVRRHVPILPPHTAIIVAHTDARNGTAALGASYDHRVLTGGEVAAVLRALSVPDEGDQSA
jgi:pyruvate dehydrogenase E2 component (dihydrolipoamide acetyltransferase)